MGGIKIFYLCLVLAYSILNKISGAHRAVYAICATILGSGKLGCTFEDDSPNDKYTRVLVCLHASLNLPAGYRFLIQSKGEIYENELRRECRRNYILLWVGFGLQRAKRPTSVG